MEREMKLKPLEWFEVQPGWWRCDTGFGRYLVDMHSWWSPDAVYGRCCDSIDHGKSLCQADYEHRVGELFEAGEMSVTANAIVDRTARNVESPVDFDSAVALLDRVTDELQRKSEMNAQVVAMYTALIYQQVAILEAMKAANTERERHGQAVAYHEESFSEVSNELLRIATALKVQ